MNATFVRRCIIAIVVLVAVVAVIGMIADHNFTTITDVAVATATFFFVWWWTDNQGDEDE